MVHEETNPEMDIDGPGQRGPGWQDAISDLPMLLTFTSLETTDSHHRPIYKHIHTHTHIHTRTHAHSEHLEGKFSLLVITRSPHFLTLKKNSFFEGLKPY